MDINDLRSFTTVLTVVLFAGIVWWALSARRKPSFDEAARIPLEEDDDVADVVHTTTGTRHADQ